MRTLMPGASRIPRTEVQVIQFLDLPSDVETCSHHTYQTASLHLKVKPGTDSGNCTVWHKQKLVNGERCTLSLAHSAAAMRTLMPATSRSPRKEVQVIQFLDLPSNVETCCSHTPTRQQAYISKSSQGRTLGTVRSGTAKIQSMARTVRFRLLTLRQQCVH